MIQAGELSENVLPTKKIEWYLLHINNLAKIQMKADFEKYPPQWHRIMRQHNNLLCALEEEYKFNHPDRPGDEFLNKIYYDLKLRISSMMKKGDVDKERLNEFIASREDDENRWIYFSCAYALASERTVIAGDLNLAWQLQCSAHLQYGLAASTDRSNKIFVQELLNIHLKAISQDGRDARDKAYGLYKDAAIEFLRTKKWISFGKAKMDVAAKLREKFPGAEGDKYKVSTVAGWIRELPMDVLDVLIPTYRIEKELGQARAKKRTEKG